MRRGLSSKWAAWQRRVFSRAEFLTARFGGSHPPLPLREIAREQRVRRFVFGALPVDGGLAVEDGGFVIYIGCDDDAIRDLQTRIEDAEDGGRSLTPRMRFTIAHEIAHTFFYDLRNRTPARLVSSRSQKELDSLERTCNQGAARLLMPDRFLKPALQNVRGLAAQHLTSMSLKFRVSPEAIVHRLGHSKFWIETGAAALVIERIGAGLFVRGIAMDGPMRMLFPKAVVGAAITSLGIFPELAAYGGNQNSIDVDIKSKMASKPALQRCCITCDRVGNGPDRYLMTIHRIGQPRPAI